MNVGPTDLAETPRDALSLPRRVVTREPFAWSRHPAPFDLRVVEYGLDALQLPKKANVLDPFCGAAVAGTHLAGRGDGFLGLEVHPVTALTARVKFERPGPSDDLRRVARELAAFAQPARPGPLLLREPDVLVRSIDPCILAILVSLRNRIATLDSPWSDHLNVALLGVLRDCAPAGWPAPRPSHRRRTPPEPLATLLARVDAMAHDLAAAPRDPLASIRQVDSRNAAAWRDIPAGSLDGCLTSPPYLNQLSYAEASRLELAFLGLARDWSSMSALMNPLLVAACTQQVTVRRAARSESTMARYPTTARMLSNIALRLFAAQRERRRAKRYDAVLWAYWADIAAVLAHLLPALAPGARAVWVIGDSAPYGVHVDAPALLSLLAAEMGFDVLDDRLARHRGGRWPGVGDRHSRRLEERMIVLRRPAWGIQQSLPGL